MNHAPPRLAEDGHACGGLVRVSVAVCRCVSMNRPLARAAAIARSPMLALTTCARSCRRRCRWTRARARSHTRPRGGVGTGGSRRADGTGTGKEAPPGQIPPPLHLYDAPLRDSVRPVRIVALEIAFRIGSRPSHDPCEPRIGTAHDRGWARRGPSRPGPLAGGEEEEGACGRRSRSISSRRPSCLVAGAAGVPAPW